MPWPCPICFALNEEPAACKQCDWKPAAFDGDRLDKWAADFDANERKHEKWKRRHTFKADIPERGREHIDE